jgi:hypothetical protein
VANFVSGWWWAKGNIKFYLVMQLDPSALAMLPYERKGGVFTVTDLIGQEPASVWFSRIDYLTQAARYLPPGYCQNPPPDESQHGWRVVTAQEAGALRWHAPHRSGSSNRIAPATPA